MKRLALATLLLASITTFAQRELTLPDASPAAAVSMNLGVTKIDVNYHSPGVKERKVWGELVPYGEIWRAGADENTTVSFSTPVSIEGKKLAAGKYGLHVIPVKEGKWTVIFSKNNYSWGSYFYDKSQDALRVELSPQNAEQNDWLNFTFSDFSSTSAVLNLNWAYKKLPIKVTIDLNETVVEDLRHQLNGVAGFDGDAYFTAAQYCLNRKLNETEARLWLQESINMKPGFNNQYRMAALLKQEGKTAEADALQKKALGMATEGDLNLHAYQLLNGGKTAEALAIFKDIVKKYPNSWNAYDSLGEAYEKSGNKKEALNSFKAARQKAPADQHSRIDSIIKRLSA